MSYVINIDSRKYYTVDVESWLTPAVGSLNTTHHMLWHLALYIVSLSWISCYANISLRASRWQRQNEERYGWFESVRSVSVGSQFSAHSCWQSGLSILLRWDANRALFATTRRVALNSCPKRTAPLFCFAKNPNLIWAPSNTSASLNFGRRKKINGTWGYLNNAITGRLCSDAATI